MSLEGLVHVNFKLLYSRIPAWGVSTKQASNTVVRLAPTLGIYRVLTYTLLPFIPRLLNLFPLFLNSCQHSTSHHDLTHIDIPIV